MGRQADSVGQMMHGEAGESAGGAATWRADMPMRVRGLRHWTPVGAAARGNHNGKGRVGKANDVSAWRSAHKQRRVYTALRDSPMHSWKRVAFVRADNAAGQPPLIVRNAAAEDPHPFDI